MRGLALKKPFLMPKTLRNISGIILLLSLLLIGFHEFQEKLPSSNFDIANNIITLNGLKNGGISAILITITVKFALLILPIFTIPLFEAANNGRNNIFNLFNETSIGRLNHVEGYKLADIWYFFLYLLSSQLQFLVMFSTIGLAALNEGIGDWFHGIYQSIMPLPNSKPLIVCIFIFALLISDMAQYFCHRLAHHVGFIWDLHEFHHSASEMTILNNFRELPIENTIKGTLILPITIFTGLLINEYLSQGYLIPLYIYLIDSMIQRTWGVLAHSGLKVLFPKPINFIYMSPSLHWFHHSIEPRHFHSNFGEKFVFWDKLFGTYLDESNLQEIKQYGVINSQYNKYHPLFSFAILPILKLIKRAKLLLFTSS